MVPLRGHASLFLLMFMLVFIGTSILIFTRLPNFIERENAVEILRAVIQVDGIFIGFVSLFIIFILREYQHYLYQKKRESFDIARRKEDEHKKTMEWYSESIASAIAPILIFLASIISSIDGMTATSAVPRDTLLPPLIFMVIGVASIIFTIFTLD